MDDLAACKVLIPDIRYAQEHIRPRLPGKGEAPFPAGRERYKGHGGHRLPAQLRAEGRHLIVLQGLYQETAKIIVPHLAEDSGGQPVPGRCNSHIGRRAPWIADIAALFCSRDKVNETFPITEAATTQRSRFIEKMR